VCKKITVSDRSCDVLAKTGRSITLRRILYFSRQ